MMMTRMRAFNQSIKLHLEVDKSAVTLIRLWAAHNDCGEDEEEDNDDDDDKDDDHDDDFAMKF